ncbi:MAG: hypothetical protein IKL28_10090 [Lachnospiraceae bacterium]|nr:hypothetical protein [Lachnospiraceae bacterium]
MKKKMLCRVVALLAMCFMLTGCGVIYNDNNENIQFVKEGTNSAYPGTTYGEAFDDFFSSPRWSYFEADTGEDVVEFTGGCYYNDVKVDALMQFTLDKSAGTFEVTYLSFNDVAQNKLMIAALLEKVFEE